MINEHVVTEEASWDQVRRWDQLRGDMETSIARTLQLKLDRLGQKKWLEECEKEMGWGRTQAYAHLNPQGMAKDRARKSSPEFPDAAVCQNEETQTVRECPVPAADERLGDLVLALNALADSFLALGPKKVIQELRKGVKGGVYDPKVLLPQIERALTELINLKQELEKM